MGPLKFENREEIQRCHLSPASQLRCKARRLALTMASSPSTSQTTSYTLFFSSATSPSSPPSPGLVIVMATITVDHSGRTPTFLPEEYRYTVPVGGREGKENREKRGEQPAEKNLLATALVAAKQFCNWMWQLLQTKLLMTFVTIIASGFKI